MNPTKATEILKTLLQENEEFLEKKQADAIRAAITALGRFKQRSLPATSLAELKEDLAAEKWKEKLAPEKWEIGDIALEKNGQSWRLVDLRENEDGEDEAILMVTNVIDYLPFSIPDKRHPWGWNNYKESYIRERLNTDILENLFGDEAGELADYHGWGRLFLLSESEAGFEQNEDTFAYFRGTGEDLDERRALKDYEGDEASWWMRSPDPGLSNNVRATNTAGTLSYNGADGGDGAAPACKIIY